MVNHKSWNNDPLLELSVSQAGWQPLTFVVENNRIFTSYYRLRPSGAYEDRVETILTEQEFQRISELLSAVINDYYYAIDNWLPRDHGSEWFTLKHNGYTYVDENAVHVSLLRLHDELRRLSLLRLPR